MKQGEPGDTAYVVIKGEFEIQKQSGPSVIKIDMRKPGEIIGEMALLSNAPRSATVVAVTTAKRLRISQKYSTICSLPVRRRRWQSCTGSWRA